MNFTYENQGTNTYLVYRIMPDDKVDTMSLGMITNNRIAGIVPTIYTQLDAEKYIKYNITARITAKEFLSGIVNRKRLVGVFSSILKAVSAAEEYMIDIASLRIDLEYIYTDVSTCEATLICLPILGAEKSSVDLATFFKEIVFSTQFDQTENCDYVAKIINYLNSAPVFSIAEFGKILADLNSDENAGHVSAGVASPMPASQPQPPRETPIPQSVTPENFAKPVQQPAMTPTTGSYETPQPAPAAKIPGSGIPQGRAAVQMPTPVPAPIPAQEIVLPPKPDNGGSLADKENISLFSLMAHYSKENKELYDYQKTVKKMQKQAGKQSSAACAKPKASKKQQAAPNPGFAVPNQPNPGFAIPNQAPSSSMPQQAPMQSIPQPQQMQPMAQQTPVQQQSQKLPQQPKPAGNANGVNPSVPPQVLARMTTGANFGETTVLGVGMEAGETTVLGAAQAQMVNPYLLRAKNNERITLNKPVFRIGKEKSYVDYFIGDNTAVSRSHANIVNKNNEFYIVDTNSTNHTYVDNVMVQSNVETRIEHGAKIRLANEEFTFYMY